MLKSMTAALALVAALYSADAKADSSTAQYGAAASASRQAAPFARKPMAATLREGRSNVRNAYSDPAFSSQQDEIYNGRF